MNYLDVNNVEDLIEEIKYVYLSDTRPWIIGYSGGKDSTVVVELVYTMLLSLRPDEHIKNVHIVSSDTLIENPMIKIYLERMVKQLGEHARRDNIPLKSTMVTPDPSNSFWANVIGRGFPTPRMNGTFRWCTDRLKIDPSNRFVNDIIRDEANEVVVLLGVRKAESISRRRRIEGREHINRLLTRHETLNSAFVYNPIVELTTEDVWDLLLSYNNGKTPWGTDNSELVALYSGADGGECPFTGISSSDGQGQSCGNSRFGCWVCTVVKEDKSLNGFIKNGYRELIPLAEFRTWLMSIRDVEEYRDKKRRDGSVYFTKEGLVGYGPFNWRGRKVILSKLLETQKIMNYMLITQEELKAIDEIWDCELDLSRRALVDLYYQETGEKLPWHDMKQPLITEDAEERLTVLSAKYDIPLELSTKMLLIAYKNRHFSNPKQMKDSLDRLLNQQWLHQDMLKELTNEN